MPPKLMFSDDGTTYGLFRAILHSCRRKRHYSICRKQERVSERVPLYFASVYKKIIKRQQVGDRIVVTDQTADKKKVMECTSQAHLYAELCNCYHICIWLSPNARAHSRFRNHLKTTRRSAYPCFTNRDWYMYLIREERSVIRERARARLVTLEIYKQGP